MSKRFWIIIAVIAVIFVGALYFGGNKDNSGSNGSDAQATNHVRGKLDSKVTFEEYGDFQCPVCGSYYPTVSQVEQKYMDKVKFQFRNLPLSQVHQHAFAAARAAEAASDQNKFWEMYDLLFQNQNTWSSSNSSTSYFNQYAQQLGLDTTKFQKDFASDAVNKKINSDIAAFKKTGDSMATPTFYLNGKQIQLSQVSDDKGPSVDKFSALLDNALKAQGQQ
jgi:protein-disulfide isomerase